jgi:hypothetical protein
VIKIIFIVDEADTSLGDFFSYCGNILKQIFTAQKMNIIKFPSAKIKNDVGISIRLEQINSNFIFIALSHGSESELIGSDLPYIAIETNVAKLINSLSFCFSCNAGKLLGKKIVASGGKCFVGHNSTVYANNIGKWKELFSKPIVCFWENFILGNTVNSCINAKKAEYTRLIDEIYETDYFHAAYLLNNRDSLVVYGDGNCSVGDFIIP